MTIELEKASVPPCREGPSKAPVTIPFQGMTGQNIICFAKEWGEDPTSCNHVLGELARNNRVLWLNSISTRAPNLASGRDLRKVLRRVTAALKGATPIGDRMWLFSPFVLPFHHSRWAILLNRQILRLTLYVLRRRLGMRSFQLWTFVPTSSEYVGHLGSEMVVYYCTDEWSSFRAVDGKKIGEMVRSLATRADVVFATSQPLVEKLSKFNPRTYLASHGVPYQMFARALDESTAVPADLLALPRPILGYYGLIEEWLDLDLIAHLATRRPEWTLVLVGKTCVDTSRLTRFSNVRFLGRKPHSELPAFCKGFDVALIPHKVNELTRHMNPIKLREYLSAGLQIVSTDLPETRHLPDYCIVARDYEEFEAGIEKALKNDSPPVRRQRSCVMQDETWDRKVEKLGATVLRVRAESTCLNMH
ncbi:MAG: glycosyl transferase group 1 [Gammaproteobacteria bacterium]|nr:glycosyl transferase group 1 [Gammaproteobacteria bacterium]